jgi:electron transport complex protein RnfD
LAISIQAAPYLRASLQVSSLMWVLAAAAAGLSAVGWVFYGPLVAVQAMTGLAVAALIEWLCSWVTDRFSIGSLAHSLAMGLIVVLMLPPGPTLWTGVAATVIGAAAGVGVGKWLMGGLGHYPWHPAVVGIITLYVLWPGAVTPQRWPLLARDHVLVGDGLELRPLQPVPVLLDWSAAVPAHDAIGFALPRAETVLRQAAQGTGGPAGEGSQNKSAAGPVAIAVRDLLPSGWDMLTGAVPGPIGQGSTLAIVAAGLVLIWRGYLRWAVPLSAVIGAAAAAAILPAGEAGWLPVRYFVDQQPVGLIWAGYQVLLGSTMFAAVMLAGETVTSPLTRRGQMVYGLGVGMLTVGLRWWPTALLAGCWAVLAMNMLVPVIDWLDRRWRIGRGG